MSSSSSPRPTQWLRAFLLARLRDGSYAKISKNTYLVGAKYYLFLEGYDQEYDDIEPGRLGIRRITDPIIPLYVGEADFIQVGKRIIPIDGERVEGQFYPFSIKLEAPEFHIPNRIGGPNPYHILLHFDGDYWRTDDFRIVPRYAPRQHLQTPPRVSDETILPSTHLTSTETRLSKIERYLSNKFPDEFFPFMSMTSIAGRAEDRLDRIERFLEDKFVVSF